MCALAWASRSQTAVRESPAGLTFHGRTFINVSFCAVRSGDR